MRSKGQRSSNPRRAPQETRWRSQDVHRQPRNRCQCGKLYFPDTEVAQAKAEELTVMMGAEHYVYEHHGRVHLTTEIQG